jgi:hypothetical protein
MDEFGLPKRERETLVAMIVAEMMTQGLHFDSHNIYALPFNSKSVKKAFRTLIDSGVARRLSVRGKYQFTDEFLAALKEDITREMPRGLFVHYPDFDVFDVCGIGSWTEDEFESYVKRLKERWLLRKRQEEARRPPTSEHGNVSPQRVFAS